MCYGRILFRARPRAPHQSQASTVSDLSSSYCNAFHVVLFSQYWVGEKKTLRTNLTHVEIKRLQYVIWNGRARVPGPAEPGEGERHAAKRERRSRACPLQTDPTQHPAAVTTVSLPRLIYPCLIYRRDDLWSNFRFQVSPRSVWIPPRLHSLCSTP